MEKRKTQVITGEVRFSYAHVWEPSSINGGDEKYSVSIIIPKSDTKTIKAINNAIEAAKQEGIAKFGGKIPANLKLPLRDGDTDREDDETMQTAILSTQTAKPHRVLWTSHVSR